MEELNYYTPSIKEFHVDFECEIATISSNGDKGWNKRVITIDDFYPPVSQLESSLIEEATWRVKYLDEADIKSLGFENVVDADGFIYGYINIPGDKDTLKRKGRIVYNKQSKYTSLKYCTELLPDTWVMSFGGTIKNKSELKRILKQIGYETNA